MGKRVPLADAFAVQYVEGCLEDNFCIAVIKVKCDVIAAERNSILKHYLQSTGIDQSEYYNENLDYTIQESFGLPKNVDWLCWLHEIPLQSLTTDLPVERIDESIFAADAEISKVEQIFLEEDNVCFKVQCGLNRLAIKVGTTLERMEMIADKIFVEDIQE